MDWFFVRVCGVMLCVEGEKVMGKGILLWLIGVLILVILIFWLLFC